MMGISEKIILHYLNDDNDLKLNCSYSDLVSKLDWLWGSDDEKQIRQNPSYDHNDLYITMRRNEPVLCGVTSQNDSYVIVHGIDAFGYKDGLEKLIEFSDDATKTVANWYFSFLEKEATSSSSDLEDTVIGMICYAEKNGTYQDKLFFINWLDDKTMLSAISTHNTIPEDYFDCCKGLKWNDLEEYVIQL